MASRTRKEFDIVVVGSGAGLTGIAIPSARNGLRVCLIEEGPLGGTCLNRGCIPSKMLLHPAEVAHEMEESKKLHLHTHGVERHHQALVEEVCNHIDKAAENWKPKVEEHGIHLIQDHVTFVDKRVLRVESTGEELTAPKIFIACGARPAAPPLDGLEGTPYITYVEALRLTKKPKSVCVIGGGYIGAELAFFLHEMGIKVTVLDSKANLADREDEEVAEEFMKVFTSIIDVKPEVNVKKVGYNDGAFTVEYGDDQKTHTIEAEQLLVATGVQANCDKLQLEKTGVELTDKGMVKADECLRTTCEGVWALGDCVGNYMFRHSANFEAEYLLRSAALAKGTSPQQPIDYAPMPHAVFSYPQMSAVGKTEQELKEEGTEYIKGVAPYNKAPMGMALRAKHGFAKVLVDKASRKILGFHVIGSDANKLVHEVIPVMTMGGKMDDILKCIHIHPALNEVVRDAFREARDAFLEKKLDIPDDIRYK